jgi:surface antigen
MTKYLATLAAAAFLATSPGAQAESRGQDRQGDTHRSDRHRGQEIGWDRDRRSGECWVSRQWTHGGYRNVVRCDRPHHHHEKQHRSHRQVYTYIQPVPVPSLPPATVYGGDFRDPDGRYCREYQSQAVIAGQWQQIYGTACRNPDGSWALTR